MSAKEGETVPPPEIVNLVTLNDTQGIKNLLLKGEGKVSDADSNGMTAIHHASYKGNDEICKLLLEHGADVNDDSHDHRYSPLHFAALSGSIETVKLLLESGAKSYHTNTLGRTAAQMAAFVGNHAVVALINNYLPISSVSYYASPQGLDKEPKLLSSVVKPLYNLIMQVNLHPVKIALTVEKSPELQANLLKAVEVLNLMREKEHKRPENVNEVICIKLHYLSYVLKTLENENSKIIEEKVKEKNTSFYESIIRKWLRGRPSDGYEEHLEYYMRDAIKAFPHPEMPLFMQLVQNISGTKIGDSWALSILSGCINGQRAFQDDKGCSACGEESKSSKRCSKCRYSRYCSPLCQKLHWVNHKKFCDSLLQETLKREKELAEEQAAKQREEKLKENSKTDSSEEVITSDMETMKLTS